MRAKDKIHGSNKMELPGIELMKSLVYFLLYKLSNICDNNSTFNFFNNFAEQSK